MVAMANHTWLKSNEGMHSDTIVFSSLILMHIHLKIHDYNIVLQL